MRVGAFLAVVLLWLAAEVAPAHAQTAGLEYSEDVVFTVLDDSVRVDMNATMRNTTVDRREGDTIFFSFFETFVFVAPKNTSDLVATTGGRTLALTRESLDTDFDLVTAALPEHCLLYTSPSPRDRTRSRMPSSA